jgi:hypothetical protein
MSNKISSQLHRVIDTPIREGLTWMELWKGSDRGLIWCWERGRQRKVEEPDLAMRARKGEFVPLAWKRGTLQYLATWQGLRDEDLSLDLNAQVVITCSKTKKSIVFKPGILAEGDGT